MDLASVVVPLVVLTLLLSGTTKGFLSAYNIYSDFQLIAIFIIIGLAQMSVLALGQMNLAVGAIGCLSTFAFGFTMQELHLPIVPVILITLLFGVLQGAFQGFLVTRTRINPFIISLALLSLYQGIAYVLTAGAPFSDLTASFVAFGSAEFLGLPLSFYVSVVICILMYILVRYRKIGKKLLACGANGTAAVYSGVNYKNTALFGHCLSGLLAAVAAILQISRYGSAQMVIGSDWMMTSFVVPILGGTLLSGGKVNVIGCFLGAVLMVVIDNAIVLWGVSTYATQLTVGIILLAAFEIDRIRKDMMQKSAARSAEE